MEADAASRAKAEAGEAEASTRAVTPTKHIVRRERHRRWMSWLALTAMGTLLLWPQGMGPEHAEEEFTGVRCSPEATGKEPGSISLGDSMLASAEPPGRAPAARGVALEVPPQPLPGQLKPDANGRCRKGQFAINGGCWLKLDVDLKDCTGNGFMHKRGCYAPVFPPTREPTSAPVK
jgi:serine/threonine-protein kinase